MTTTAKDYTAVLLAGGQSRRMGRPKALLPWKGQTIAQHLMAVVAPLVSSGLVVGTHDLPLAEGWTACLDQHPGYGPVGALATALPRLNTPYGLVLSCDLPLLDRATLHHLLAGRGDASVACFRTADGQVHPLIGVYAQSLGAHFEQALAVRHLRLLRVLRSLHPRVLPCPTALEVALTNVNTPEQYQQIYATHH
mgnify:CR=1 FL=1